MNLPLLTKEPELQADMLVDSKVMTTAAQESLSGSKDLFKLHVVWKENFKLYDKRRFRRRFSRYEEKQYVQAVEDLEERIFPCLRQLVEGIKFPSLTN